MKGTNIFSFIFVMWILIILGGGLLVLFTGPISIIGHIEIGPFFVYYSSIVKALIAIALVVIWIYILSKIKNWIFNKQIRH